MLSKEEFEKTLIAYRSLIPSNKNIYMIETDLANKTVIVELGKNMFGRNYSGAFPSFVLFDKVHVKNTNGKVYVFDKRVASVMFNYEHATWSIYETIANEEDGDFQWKINNCDIYAKYPDHLRQVDDACSEMRILARVGLFEPGIEEYLENAFEDYLCDMPDLFIIRGYDGECYTTTEGETDMGWGGGIVQTYSETKEIVLYTDWNVAMFDLRYVSDYLTRNDNGDLDEVELCSVKDILKNKIYPDIEGLRFYSPIGVYLYELLEY